MSNTTKQPYILKELRMEQAIADETIQREKPAIYKSCIDYKQAQINRNNLETQIITISNSRYNETPKKPKLQTMDTNAFCRKFVDELSRKFDLGLSEEQQLQKLEQQTKSKNTENNEG